MANFGRCKNCWWWNQKSKTRGNCVFYRNESDINSYCPDYHSRKKGDKKQTLEDFCKEEGTEYITYRELY